jgi:hypothetical protein
MDAGVLMTNSDEALPSDPRENAVVWARIRKWRFAFLACGVAGIGLSLALTAALTVTRSAYLTDGIQIWDATLGPLSGHGGSPEKAYKLTVDHPAQLYLGDDLPITVSLSDVASTYQHDPNARVHIAIDGPSLKIVPANGIDLTLKDGSSTTFLVTASAVGNKSVRVVDQFWITDAPTVREKPLPSSKAEELFPRKPDAEDARIINLVVLDRSVFMIFNRTVTTDLQVIASIIGIPGLLVFLLSGWRERRKAAAEKRKEDAAHRVVKAPADLQKQRKIER